MGCASECYTKGRGCVVSIDGRCAVQFPVQEIQYVKSFKAAHEKILKDFNERARKKE